MQHTNLHRGSRTQYYCQCLTGSSNGTARTDGLAGVRTSTRTANGHGAEARIDAHLIDMGIFVQYLLRYNHEHYSIRTMVPTVELD